jgi:amino acid transporter
MSKNKANTKHRVFIILWLASIILIFASIMSPWWYNIEERHEDIYVERYRSEWTLTHVSTRYDSDIWPDESWISSYNAETFEYSNVAGVWLNTFFIVLLALALNFAVFWIYIRFRNFKATREWVITILALATIVTLVVPLFVMFSLPDKVCNDCNALNFPESEQVYTSFWGEKHDNTTELSGIIEKRYEWGPMYGWGMFWVVFGLNVIMLLMVAPPPKPTEADRKLPSGAAGE